MRAVIIVLTALMGFSVTCLAADTGQKPRTLTLTGQGEVKSAPDMAIIRLGVVREAKTAQEAVSANNQAMEEVINVVLSNGVEEKDVQTSRFTVSPRYTRYPPSKSGPQRPPKIAGYSVSNNLAIIIRDLSGLGGILDAVVSVGSNRIDGVSFSIQKPKPLQDEARRKAVADALAKAQLYAKAASVELGPIIAMSERGGFRPPQPVYARRMSAKAFAADAVPIAQGQQSLKMQVHIVWQIK